MALSSKATLKSYFETGDTPTQAQFAELIERMFTQYNQGRHVIQYQSGSGVNFNGLKRVAMGGFRFRGSYIGDPGPVIDLPTSKIIDFGDHLSVLSSVEANQWYACFAVADEGDATVTYKIMPYLRVKSVAASVVTLGEFKEAAASPDDASYAWTADNNLNGADVLIISRNGEFSGDVTTASANTTDTITLADVTSFAANDMLLPAPVGFDYYHYLGSFYRESTEVRNFYDTGSLIKSKGVNIPLPTGVEAGTESITQLTFIGHISPLATGVTYETSCVFSTSSTGDFAEYVSPDSSSHTVQTNYTFKGFTSSLSVIHHFDVVPFLLPQLIFYTNAGSISSLRSSGIIRPVGWIEP